MRQFEVTGRKKPSDVDPTPEVYKMKIFASNAVVARSRFWYFLGQQKKVKRASGEIMNCSELFDKKPTTIKNYGIWLRYDSRSGTHNMYKEFRALSVHEAIDKLYANMTSLHRAHKSSIQIIKTAVISSKATKRTYTWEYLNNDIKFQVPHRVTRPSSKTYRKTFKATKPSTFF